MSSATKQRRQPLVRIDADDKAVLEQLAAKTGESTPRLLHRAVPQLNKQIFFEQMNSGYREMRQDLAAWEAELQERELFEGAIAYGLTR